MGRHKKFKPKELEEKWEEYKEYCDSRSVIRTEFSAKECVYVTTNEHKYITYTIEGFCVYLKVARSGFYSSYFDDPRYMDIVTRIREECEVDQRQKFETGAIPTKLAGMWMSKYEDYKTKQEVMSHPQL